VSDLLILLALGYTAGWFSHLAYTEWRRRRTGLRFVVDDRTTTVPTFTAAVSAVRCGANVDGTRCIRPRDHLGEHMTAAELQQRLDRDIRRLGRGV
jgi:hypothetical protein